MKKTMLGVASALLLTGVMTSTASAQSGYYYDRDDYYHDDTYSDAWDDYDRDGVDDRYDRYDNRRDVIWDRDGDGVNDRYERTGYRDRDRDGVPNRYDRFDDRRHFARHRYNAGRYYAPRNYTYVRYSIGSRLPRSYYGGRYYIDYRPYGLYAPPPGYRWNRVGSDAYLVAVTNGLVRDVIYSLFY